MCTAVTAVRPCTQPLVKTTRSVPQHSLAHSCGLFLSQKQNSLLLLSAATPHSLTLSLCHTGTHLTLTLGHTCAHSTLTRRLYTLLLLSQHLTLSLAATSLYVTCPSCKSNHIHTALSGNHNPVNKLSTLKSNECPIPQSNCNTTAHHQNPVNRTPRHCFARLTAAPGSTIDPEASLTAPLCHTGYLVRQAHPQLQQAKQQAQR
jgi:hypothetical protein